MDDRKGIATQVVLALVSWFCHCVSCLKSFNLLSELHYFPLDATPFISQLSSARCGIPHHHWSTARVLCVYVAFYLGIYSACIHCQIVSSSSVTMTGLYHPVQLVQPWPNLASEKLITSQTLYKYTYVHTYTHTLYTSTYKRSLLVYDPSVTEVLSLYKVNSAQHIIRKYRRTERY